jgi:hypothetical protein
MTSPVTLALDALRLALAPFIADARASATQPGWFQVQLHCSPVKVFIVLHDDAGAEVATYHPVTIGEDVADALAGTLQAWQATLTPAEVRKVGARLARHPGALWLFADSGVAVVQVLIDRGDGTAEIVGRLTDEVWH